MSFWKKNGWALLLFAFLSLFYLHFLKPKSLEVNLLSQRLEAMQQQKFQVLCMQQDLELRIHSQSDPAWIELVLMRDLGVVPEGFLKVHFQK